MIQSLFPSYKLVEMTLDLEGEKEAITEDKETAEELNDFFASIFISKQCSD